jgi:DNA-binding transcriptional ArsR family regulator
VTTLPLFRSQTQALVLTRLLLGPGEESLTDLAIAVGSYKNSVKHEVDHLEAAGLVSSRPVGRSRLVSVSAGEPVRSILLDLVLHTYGPIHVVTAAAWAKPKGAFLSAVKANPLAIVPLDSPHLGEAS